MKTILLLLAATAASQAQWNTMSLDQQIASVFGNSRDYKKPTATNPGQTNVWPSNEGMQFPNPLRTTPTTTPSPAPKTGGLTFPPPRDNNLNVNRQPTTTPRPNPTTTPLTFPTLRDDDEKPATIVRKTTVPIIPTRTTPSPRPSVPGPTRSTSYTTPVGPTFQPTPPTTDDCVCVPHNQCYQGELNVDGVGMMTIRVGGCESKLEVCCKRTNITLPGSPLPSSSTPPSNDDVCGASKKKNLGDRILTVEDGEAEYGKFPWMAAILRGPRLIYECGGSLVHRQVVLTAAHCVLNSTDLTVRLGEWDVRSLDEPHMHQDKRVAKTVRHPDYRKFLRHHDLAVLFLDDPVISAPNTGTICLPESSDVFNGARCFVSGWGKDAVDNAKPSRTILKQVDVPVVDHSTCQDNLRQTSQGQFFRLHSTFMCAGGEAGKDACKGDGGGPLMCPHPQDSARYVQAGVVAWGEGCGVRNVPGVYTNVASLREWIDQQLLENRALLKN